MILIIFYELAIHISSVVKFCSSSPYFLFSSLLGFEISLYVLNARPLSDILFENIFPQIVACFFYFLNSVFHRVKFYISMKSKLKNIFLYELRF